MVSQTGVTIATGRPCWMSAFRSTLRRQTSELSRQAFSEGISAGLQKPAIFFHMIFTLG